MSGKFTVRIDLKDEKDGGDVSVFADDGHLAIQTGGEEHAILDDRTVLGTLASQDADSVTITGGTITGITDMAVADGGTGASTAAGALTNLGAVPTSRTVNGKALSSDITLSNSDIGSEPAITAGTTAQFWRGDKSWTNLGDSVRAAILTGLSTATNASIAATDTIIVAFGKLQAQVSNFNPMTKLGQIIVGDDGGVPVALDKGTGHQVLGHLIPDPENPDDPNRLEVGWVDAVMPNTGESGNAYVTDLAFGESSTGVLVMEQTSRSIVDYSGSTREIALPLADADRNGFMAKEDVTAIANHEIRIAALEGRASRFAVTIPDDPTQQQLTELYDDASGETGDPTYDGVMLVDMDKGISYTWFLSDSSWHGPESNSVSLFTNTSAGIIKGSSGSAGKVYAENDGSGSVYGWDALNTTVAGKQNALTFATTSAVSNSSGALDVKVDGTTLTKNASTGVLSSSAMANPMTAAGDIIVGGTSGSPERLAPGMDGQSLTMENGIPTWQNPSATGIPIEKVGDLVAGADFEQLRRVPIGHINDVLTVIPGTRQYPDIEYSYSSPDILKKWSIAYGSSKYLVSTDYYLGYSSDIAGNFSLVPAPMTGSSTNKLKFLSGYFFYYGSSGALWYTTDPTALQNWTKIELGTTSTIADMAYFNGYYFAIAGTSSYQSSSPSGTWSSKTTGLSGGGRLAQNGNSQLALKYSNSVAYLTSASGSWNTVDLGISYSSAGLAYGNGYWCFAYTPSSTTVGVGYSTNLTSWAYNTSIYTTTVASPYDMYFFNGTFETYDRRSTSPTGTWAQSSYAASGYSDKYWVNGYYCYSLPDTGSAAGKKMTYQLGLEGASSYINCYYGEGSIDVGGGSPYPMVLYPNIAYDPRDTGRVLFGRGNMRYNEMCFAANYFVTVGEGGYIISTNWALTSSSVKNSGTTENLRSITYGNGTWVAVGNNGTIRYSTDISTWNAGGSGITENLKRVRWCGDRFIAIAESDSSYTNIYHSRDGATWYRLRVSMSMGEINNIIDAVFFKGVVYLLINGRFSPGETPVEGTQLVPVTSFPDMDDSIDVVMASAIDDSIVINRIEEVLGVLTMVGNGGYAAVMDSPDTTTATKVPTATTDDIVSIRWNSSNRTGLVAMKNSTRYGSCRFITVAANDVGWQAPGGGGGSDGWVPSNQYTDITYGASGDTYSAPANGWVYVQCTTFNTNAYITGKVIISTGASAEIYGATATTYSANKDLAILFPVGAAYAFRMFNSNLTVNIFRFIYAKGALVGA